MTKSRKVFWFIFALYFLIAVASSFIADLYQNDLGFLIGMKGYIPLVKYFFILGAILFIMSFVFTRKNSSDHKKEVDKYESDKKSLKVKLFDLQEEYNNILESKAPTSPNIAESNSDKTKIE